MTPATTWIRYKGDGSTPSDAAVQNRGETGRYLADPKLVTAVNTALAVEQPLLVHPVLPEAIDFVRRGLGLGRFG